MKPEIDENPVVKYLREHKDLPNWSLAMGVQGVLMGMGWAPAVKDNYMKPNDILRVDTHTGIALFWVVSGIYLGAETQESVVEIIPIHQLKNNEGKTLVPSQILDMAISSGAIKIYRA